MMWSVPRHIRLFFFAPGTKANAFYAPAEFYFLIPQFLSLSGTSSSTLSPLLNWHQHSPVLTLSRGMLLAVLPNALSSTPELHHSSGPVHPKRIHKSYQGHT
jgi:hypothetical protein